MRNYTSVLVFMALALAATPAGARNAYMTSFEGAYPAAVGTRIDSCTVCHTSVPARNSYGAAYAGAGHSFAGIESADSDGDGFTNLAEITALTFPGNAADKPAAATGSLMVTILPTGAVTAGAQWRVGPSGVYQNSGATVTGLAAGSVTVQFKVVAGWVTPADQPLTIVAGQTATATGTYTQGVTVPNVVGQTQAAATTAITAAGLVVGAVTLRPDATVPAGMVISQTPAAGAQAGPGSAVALTVSQGPGLVTVPDVTGQTQAAATAAITGAGLVLGTVTQQNSATVAAGLVISQSPAANTQANAGSAVALVLSQGPQPVTVPDVAGLTRDAATAAITAAGLVVGQVTEAASDTVPDDSVISQSPAAGTSAAPSSPVDLVVSSGPQDSGCAGLSCREWTFSFDDITKMLGNLFVIGLTLIAMLVLNKD